MAERSTRPKSAPCCDKGKGRGKDRGGGGGGGSSGSAGSGGSGGGSKGEGEGGGKGNGSGKGRVSGKGSGRGSSRGERVATTTTVPLRLLCLHGGRQTGEIFRERLDGLFRRCRGGLAELIFLDGPHELLLAGDTAPTRGWMTDSPTRLALTLALTLTVTPTPTLTRTLTQPASDARLSGAALAGGLPRLRRRRRLLAGRVCRRRDGRAPRPLPRPPPSGRRLLPRRPAPHRLLVGRRPDPATRRRCVAPCAVGAGHARAGRRLGGDAGRNPNARRRPQP